MSTVLIHGNDADKMTKIASLLNNGDKKLLDAFELKYGRFLNDVDISKTLNFYTGLFTEKEKQEFNNLYDGEFKGRPLGKLIDLVYAISKHDELERKTAISKGDKMVHPQKSGAPFSFSKGQKRHISHFCRFISANILDANLREFAKFLLGKESREELPKPLEFLMENLQGEVLLYRKIIGQGCENASKMRQFLDDKSGQPVIPKKPKLESEIKTLLFKDGDNLIAYNVPGSFEVKENFDLYIGNKVLKLSDINRVEEKDLGLHNGAVNPVDIIRAFNEKPSRFKSLQVIFSDKFVGGPVTTNSGLNSCGVTYLEGIEQVKAMCKAAAKKYSAPGHDIFVRTIKHITKFSHQSNLGKEKHLPEGLAGKYKKVMEKEFISAIGSYFKDHDLPFTDMVEEWERPIRDALDVVRRKIKYQGLPEPVTKDVIGQYISEIETRSCQDNAGKQLRDNLLKRFDVIMEEQKTSLSHHHHRSHNSHTHSIG